MFQHMLSAHCVPDNTTYNAMFIAMQRGKQWRHALDIYHIMNNHGNRPDAVAFNMLLEVLWNTGMEVLQGKSVMLGKLAQHYGLFRYAWDQVHGSLVQQLLTGIGKWNDSRAKKKDVSYCLNYWECLVVCRYISGFIFGSLVLLDYFTQWL